jgi:2-dehydropantoate 2-reductase
MLARAFGKDRALIGTARISAYIDGPGRVRKVTRHARYTLGDREGRQDRAPVPAIRQAFEAAGIDAPEHGDVRVDLWEKFVLLTPFAAVTAGARCDAAAIAATPELMALTETLARETIAVAEARGIALPADQLARTVEGIRGLPGEMRASLAHDLAAGKPLETDWLSGAVARLGAEAGVETPAHRTVAALLAPWRHGA